jgi:flagellin
MGTLPFRVIYLIGENPMSVINTNVSALLTQNSLTTNSRAMGKAMEQLSTGKRINSAADDAAGLAISERMTTQIRGLNQAVRNANDGLSLLQTAEGAMIEMSDMLQRMRELALQAATDSNTTADRTALDDEFQQLKAEITRIGANTEWNGTKILNGNNSFGTVNGNDQDVKFQIGANASQTIDIKFKDFTFTPTGTTPTNSVTTIEFAGKTAGDDTARLTGTIGTVAFDVDFTALADDPDADGIGALRDALQTKLRAYSGLEGISVTSQGETITITDATGKAASAFAFKQADGSDATTPDAIITYANGTSSSAAAPTGGVFVANLAGSAITSQSTADAAVGYIDTAITAINSERSKVGSVMNRIGFAIENLSNISTNAAASRSRVLDTDYAAVTTELARTQIIQQAATAMLAQANQQPAAILSLLQ